MNTIEDAVKHFKGVWPAGATHLVTNGQCIEPAKFDGFYYSTLESGKIYNIPQLWTILCNDYQFETRRYHMSGTPSSDWVPEVSEIIEACYTSPDEYYDVKVLAYDGNKVIYRWLGGPHKGQLHECESKTLGGGSVPLHRQFRPLRTERDLIIEKLRAAEQDATVLYVGMGEFKVPVVCSVFQVDGPSMTAQFTMHGKPERTS